MTWIPANRHPAESHGFTLLELCLAIFIGAMLITMAIPSITGMMQGQRSEATFHKFDDLVQKARTLSLSEQRDYVIDWGKSQLLLRPVLPQTSDEAKGVAHLDLADGEQCSVAFPAALEQNPAAQWIFWASGTCEPAVISFSKKDKGGWVATYDPLNEQAAVVYHDEK